MVDVSSEFSKAFAATNAVDDDASTEWASRGDGDRAFITIDLGTNRQIRGVEFLTRSMADGSAITDTFTVTVDGSPATPPLPAGTIATPRFAALDTTGRQLRFDIVKSSGGNVGAVEIRVFGPTRDATSAPPSPEPTARLRRGSAPGEREMGMSDNDVIIGLATIVVFGVGAQWIGRRSGIPSLLLLLPAGVLAGSVFGLVEPEQLFGDALFPGITLLVSLLLFQAALGLRVRDLPRVARGPVLRLVSIGAAVTFVGAAAGVALIFDVDLNIALLVGAILVVSGPTVVGPLLAVVRPRDPSEAVLRWESIALDPIGATLGVVVLNLILASGGGVHPALQMLGRLGVGVGVGAAAAVILVFMMSRFFVPDEMEAAVALLFAVAAFAVAEVSLSEAGLFATTTLGFIAANQRFVPTARITGFGETLEVLIIGALFIVLGALVKLDDLGPLRVGDGRARRTARDRGQTPRGRDLAGRHKAHRAGPGVRGLGRSARHRRSRDCSPVLGQPRRLRRPARTVAPRRVRRDRRNRGGVRVDPRPRSRGCSASSGRRRRGWRSSATSPGSSHWPSSSSDSASRCSC